VTIAPPTGFLPFALAALEHLRDWLRERGELPMSLDAKLGVLLGVPETWATGRNIEWVAVAAGEPVFNRKADAYGGRALDLLRTFVRMVAKEAQRFRQRKWAEYAL
jgi:hypothetical protein